MIEKINLNQKFSLFADYWSPKIIANLNSQTVKLVKVKGELIWHSHENEDEMFFVMKGALHLYFEDNEVIVHEGEIIVVPKGVKHKPVANDETWIMLFEPEAIQHTGNQVCNHTLSSFERI